MMDRLGSVETFGKLRGRRSEPPQAAPSRVARSRLFLWRSRTLLKVAIFDFRKLIGSGLEARFYLIPER